jgi:hypothetical protein
VARLVAEAGEQAHEVRSAPARRDDRARPLVEQERADPVALPPEQQPDDGGELDRQVALEAAGRAPVHRAAHVEHEPDVEGALGVGLADERAVGAGGRVPVDVAHVVARLVLAQLGELEAEAAHERALVAAEAGCQRAQDGPLEPAQQRLRRLGRRASRPAARNSISHRGPPGRCAAAGSGRGPR